MTLIAAWCLMLALPVLGVLVLLLGVRALAVWLADWLDIHPDLGRLNAWFWGLL